MADTIEIIQGTATVVEVAGPSGPQGPAGATGGTGAAGQGVPAGGTTGQVLRKVSGSNYDTEWGTGGGSVTFGTTAGTATQGNDSRIADIAASSITTKQGANSGGAGGTITMRGGITGNDGAGGNSGSINLQGSDNNSNGAANGGSINLSAGAGAGGNITSVGGGGFGGGSLTMSGGSQGAGGSINTSNAGGAISTFNEGGAINTSGGGGAINTSEGGGAISTSSDGGAINTSGLEGTAGGNISTYAGEQAGGSVETYDGGGSINTRGTGSIQFGATGTRTTLTGTATENRAISLPDASGTIALTQQAADYEVTESTKGIILKSPNNTRWRLTINDDGTLSRAALALMTLLAFATSGFAQVRDMVTDTNGNIFTGRTNVLTFTNSVNIPIYSGAATTNSLLTADGAGGSAFVVSRTVTRYTTNDQTKTSWGFNALTQPNNNDPQIGSFTIDANSVYRVDFVVAFRAASNASFRCGVGFATNLADINQRAGFFQAANTSLTGIQGATNATTMAIQGTDPGNNTNHTIAGLFYIYSGTNANSMTFRWYPNNNTNVACNLLSNTMFSVTKMSP